MGSTPKHYTAQVVDMLALHLPPEKLFPQLMEPALQSTNPYQRKAGLMCLAVLAEGCGDHIRNKHLQPMLQVVCQLLSDESQVIRNVVLFALGQFSENLQADISRFSNEILPLLLHYLEGVELVHTSHLVKAYYALENFMENLGDKILATLALSGSPRIKELVVSAMGAIANAAKASMLPYFPAVMEHLKGYLLITREDLQPIQIQAIETLVILAQSLGWDIFLPLAEECCQLGLNLCDQVDDPDLWRCTYSLFGALSSMMEEAIAPHLPRITTLMLYSLKSTEGVQPQYGNGSSFLLFDDEEEEAEVEGEENLGEEEDEEDSEMTGMSVENAFMDEKEDACVALGELATSASVSFLPYMENCFQEVFKLMECPHLNVQKAAFKALGQFCVGLHRVCERDPSEPHSAALQKLLPLVLPAFVRGICQDKEQLVVMSVLEALGEVLKACQQEALREPGHLVELCRVLREVLERKTACQDPDVEEEEEQAEYDAMLIEYAGEGIPILAATDGGHTFAPYFASFLPLLLNKTNPSCSASEKSFAVGTLAEVVVDLGRASGPFVPWILPALLGAMQDMDKEGRSNGLFGLGVLAEHGGESLHKHYPKLLGVVSSILSQERSSRVMDNVCVAVARMVMAYPGGVPIDQVFPVLLRSLPFKENFKEYKTIFHCFCFLYEHDPQQVLQKIREILQASGAVLGIESLQEDAQAVLLALLRDLSSCHLAESRVSAAIGSP
uniref:Importin 4 n=1 Tax=Sphenodon punctatus TaxID=8508 RepID=A0A8D0GHS6_SPHPU